MDFNKIALEEAEKSLCKKRKVGAIIVSESGKVVASGHNYNKDNSECEYSRGNTKNSVIHAEIAAINKVNNWDAAKTIYVTHAPCKACKKAIDYHKLKLVIVENFMKFDTDKLRYSLIPPEALKGMAEVLTYGAKKYKPNNWKQADDTSRYTDALYRHLEAWRSGDKFDSESRLQHLAHALTNIAFLIHFENKNI